MTFSRVCTAALAAFLAFPLSAWAAEKPLGKADVEQIVRDYILAHPEVIVDSVQQMQAKQAAAEQEAGKKALAESKDALSGDKDTPMAGNPKGDVTLVEFFDYNCGYCRHIFPTIAKLLEKDKNVRVLFKEFPILSENSVTIAQAALAVHRLAPEKYFAFHGVVMQGKGEMAEASLLAEAEKLGIAKEKMKAEMKSAQVKAILEKNHELGRKIGIRGTPALVIGGELIPGAVELPDLEAKIAQLRTKK